MELLQEAYNKNDFGLRSRFPWSNTYFLPTRQNWTELVTDPEEIAFVKSHVSKLNPTIYRIENPYLWGRYVLRLEERAAAEADEILSIQNRERIMIHVTEYSNALSIANTNFDWRRVRRSRFGKGVSFTPHAFYANKYASGKGTYILAGLHIGSQHQGGYLTRIPDTSDFDTTTDGCGNVYVKYYDDDFYPYYIIN